VNKEENQQLVEIGKITKPHALKGEVRAFIGTSTNLLDKYITVQNKKYKVERFVSRTDNLVILKLQKINSVEQAETLRNQNIFISIEDLAEEEYSIDEMKTLEVIDHENQEIIGKVKDITNLPASPVLEVKLEGKDEILLIPFVMDTYVTKIERENKKLYLQDWKLFLIN